MSFTHWYITFNDFDLSSRSQCHETVETNSCIIKFSAISHLCQCSCYYEYDCLFETTVSLKLLSRDAGADGWIQQQWPGSETNSLGSSEWSHRSGGHSDTGWCFYRRHGQQMLHTAYRGLPVWANDVSRLFDGQRGATTADWQRRG